MRGIGADHRRRRGADRYQRYPADGEPFRTGEPQVERNIATLLDRGLAVDQRRHAERDPHTGREREQPLLGGEEKAIEVVARIELGRHPRAKLHVAVVGGDSQRARVRRRDVAVGRIAVDVERIADPPTNP